MSKKRFSGEQVVNKLREAEVFLRQRARASWKPAGKWGSPSRPNTGGGKSTVVCGWIRRSG